MSSQETTSYESCSSEQEQRMNMRFGGQAVAAGPAARASGLHLGNEQSESELSRLFCQSPNRNAMAASAALSAFAKVTVRESLVSPCERASGSVESRFPVVAVTECRPRRTLFPWHCFGAWQAFKEKEAEGVGMSETRTHRREDCKWSPRPPPSTLQALQGSLRQRSESNQSAARCWQVLERESLLLAMFRRTVRVFVGAIASTYQGFGERSWGSRPLPRRQESGSQGGQR